MAGRRRDRRPRRPAGMLARAQAVPRHRRQRAADVCQHRLRGAAVADRDEPGRRVISGQRRRGPRREHGNRRETAAVGRHVATLGRRLLAGYRRTAGGDRGRGQARPFGVSDLAAVFATCHRPRRRGRGVESDQVALERGRLDAVIASPDGKVLRCLETLLNQPRPAFTGIRSPNRPPGRRAFALEVGRIRLRHPIGYVALGGSLGRGCIRGRTSTRDDARPPIARRLSSRSRGPCRAGT